MHIGKNICIKQCNISFSELIKYHQENVNKDKEVLLLGSIKFVNVIINS